MDRLAGRRAVQQCCQPEPVPGTWQGTRRTGIRVAHRALIVTWAGCHPFVLNGRMAWRTPCSRRSVAKTAMAAPRLAATSRPSRRLVRRLAPVGAAVLAAGLYTLACPPHEWAVCAWPVPALLLCSTRRIGPLRAAFCGVLFSILMGYGVMGWAYHASLAYFDFHRLAAAGFVIGVWLVCGGIQYAIALAAHAVVAPGLPPWARAPFAAWIWTIGELLRTILFTGMPWELLGHTQFRHLNVIQIADLGGVPAVSFVMAATSVAAGEVLGLLGTRRSWRPLVERTAIAMALLAVTLIYGVGRRHALEADGASGAPRTVAVVQGNLPNEFRWKREFFERALMTYARLSGGTRQAAPELVVWPENAANFYIDHEPMLLSQLGEVAAEMRTALLMGGPRLAADGEARNAAYLIDGNGTIRATYDKQHLVPLAEYNPLRSGRPATPNEPLYSAGGEARPLAIAGMKLGTVICYEVIFPDLVRDLVRKDADILVNLSNDGWLDAGDGAAGRQHFSMAIFRAVETRRFLVRAAASGISGFVDPTGRTFGIVPSGTAGAAVGHVMPRHGETLYVRFGDAWVCVAGVLLAGTVWWHRRGPAATLDDGRAVSGREEWGTSAASTTLPQ